MSERITVANGYDRKKTPSTITGTRATVEAIKAINPTWRDEFWVVANDGTAKRCRVNGKLKTWKRDPSRIALPCKYGLYECHTFTEHDIGRILLDVTENA